MRVEGKSLEGTDPEILADEEKEPNVRDPTTGHECDYYGRGSRNGNIGYSFVGV
jgi:hypothetical protein